MLARIKAVFKKLKDKSSMGERNPPELLPDRPLFEETKAMVKAKTSIATVKGLALLLINIWFKMVFSPEKKSPMGVTKTEVITKAT